MASMFIDLGDLTANFSVEFALAYYEIAKYYYGNKSAALEKKIEETTKLVPIHKKINYKILLDNNDKSNYRIDWSKIVVNTKVLLAMVNLKMSVKEAGEISAGENHTIPGRKENELWILSGAVLLCSSLIFLSFWKK